MSDIFKYKVFDLIIHSKNLDIPDLPKTLSNSQPDVEIQQEDSSLWPQISKRDENTFYVKISRDEVRLSIEGIGNLRVTNGKKIAWDKEANIPYRDIINIILSSGIGGILIQKNILVFHGNALTKNGKAIICLGCSGAGKSTLAYALIKEGWGLIADDIVAIKSNLILPGIPRIKLWRDAVDAFNLDHKRLIKVRNKINKYILLDKEFCKTKKSFKLEKIYLITQNNQSKIHIKQIKSQQEVFLRLRNNLFRPRFLRGLGREGEIFKILVNSIDKLNVNLLSLPNDIKEMQRSLKKFDLLN